MVAVICVAATAAGTIVVAEPPGGVKITLVVNPRLVPAIVMGVALLALGAAFGSTEIITGAAAIEMDKFCDALLTVSCTVTVKLYKPPAVAATVPLMAPVVAFNVKPGGSDPENTVQLP